MQWKQADSISQALLYSVAVPRDAEGYEWVIAQSAGLFITALIGPNTQSLPVICKHSRDAAP